MRWLALVFLTSAIAAQEGATQPPESMLTGSMDFGYRWRSSVGGSLDAYRSVVDLGSGPKLFGTDLHLVDPSKRLFDRVDVRAQNWGDDPHSTASISAQKVGAYDFSLDYRNMAYFNALPSFANPALGRGLLASERSFDIRRRLASMRLDVRPGASIVPYAAYERGSGYGRGVTTFVSDANEYAVPTRLRDANDTYRGGVRFEFSRFHATGEIGKTVFKDDQQVFETSAMNRGNRETPFLGQTLFLSGLRQSYGVRGDGVFTKFLVTANPLSWLDLHGNYLYSRPETETNYQQFNTGNFAVSNAALFVTSQQIALASQSRMPHRAGSAGAEVRPAARVRVLLSWLTDRLENTGDSNFDSLLRHEYNQSDADVIVDASRQLTLRGGYRYVWGESQYSVTPASGLAGRELADLSRHIGKAGFTFRMAARFSITADAEAASGGGYFRTSLNDYQRVRFKARHQASATLGLAFDLSLLNNQNPTGSANFDFRSRITTGSILWNPSSFKRVQVHGSYSRSTIRSDTTYIAPQFFEQERSRYRDDAHTVDGRIELALPQYSAGQPRLMMGGAFFWTSGSRPTQHYQPLASLHFPITKTAAWVSEWRYHGFGQSFFGFEAFRAHLVTTGVRLSR